MESLHPGHKGGTQAIHDLSAQANERALRQMRDQRTLISQANQETRQYAKHLIDSTGIISYAEMTGDT